METWIQIDTYHIEDLFLERFYCSCFWYWGFSNKVFLKNKVPQKKKKKKKKKNHIENPQEAAGCGSAGDHSSLPMCQWLRQ